MKTAWISLILLNTRTYRLSLLVDPQDEMQCAKVQQQFQRNLGLHRVFEPLISFMVKTVPLERPYTRSICSIFISVYYYMDCLEEIYKQ